jgi:NitT/TauT family transport system substrate-binding protein
MKKNVILVLVISLILSIATITGCQKSTGKLEDTVNVKLVTPAGGPTLAVLPMLEQDLKEKYNINLEFEMVSSPSVLSSDIVSNSVDMAIIPTNLAANLYNKGTDYKIGGVAVWGNLYLIANKEIESINDIKGEEVATFGQGLTPDIIFNYILDNKGIDKDAMKLNYLPGASAVAPLFISGKTNVALVPEPMLSTILLKKPKTKIILDLQEEWAKMTKSGKSYPQAVLVINSKFVDNYKNVVDIIVKELQSSITYANENPDKLGELAEKYETGLTKKVVTNSIKGMNLDYKSATDVKEIIESYLSILKDYNEKSIGGKLPDEKIYMEK